MNNQRSAASRKRTEQPPPPPVPQKQVPVQKRPTSTVRAGQTSQGLSVSDAIGMTTVRLCRVEQLLNMQCNKEKEKEKDPAMDVSVLGTIVDRIERLEQSLSSVRDDIEQILERLNETDTNQIKDANQQVDE